MKNIVLIILVLALTAFNVNAQFSEDSISRSTLGFNMYHTSSASGYGPGVNLNMTVERESRHLEAGIIMQLESSRISGGELVYRHYFKSFNEKKLFNDNRFLNPRFFFQYNFIYRSSVLPDRLEVMEPTMEEIVVPGGRIATLEHYAGIGAQLPLFNNLYLNTGVGYGVILGSTDEKYINEPHYTMGGRKNDLGVVTKIGIGYMFRR